MIVCAHLPRFALAVAAGGREALAAGPVAIAPEAGREQFIGEASAAAEAYGVRAGLRLGEALARCPTLRLVAPDPVGVADAWDAHLIALENIGAAVESGAPGTAWFGAGGLRTLHGGTLEGVLAATRRAIGGPVRLGAAPSRFAALAAAGRARARRAEVTPLAAAALAAYLAPLPVTLLFSRPETAFLPEALERFGIRTLGALAKLPRASLADRFGAAGPLARDLALGRDRPLVPRTAAERLEERLELPESASGVQLAARAGPARRPPAGAARAPRADAARRRPLRRPGGGRHLARADDVPRAAGRRAPHAARAGPELAELPAPTDVLCLRAEGFGPPAGDQRSLLAEPAAIRRARLREAVRQARSVAGPEAALRDHPGRSRLPGARAAPGPGPVGSVRGPRRLAAPRAVRVRTGEGGRPETIEGRDVEAVRESWLVEDRWWTDAPLRRRYWEVVTADGRDLVVYRDLQRGGWFTQR